MVISFFFFFQVLRFFLYQQEFKIKFAAVDGGSAARTNAEKHLYQEPQILPSWVPWKPKTQQAPKAQVLPYLCLEWKV